jgi:NYN domain
MVSRVDRCALFVDAGYALADGAMAVHGTRRRDSVSWDHSGLLKLLAGLARDRTGLPILRCYWYETAEDRTSEHDALAEMPGLKLRLVSTRPGRREGIDSQLRRDIVTLAKSGAIADAFIASADEHIAEMVAEVQDLGLRVVILHIASDGGWTIPQSLRQECDDIVEISAVHLRPFVDLIRGAEPAMLPEQYAAAGYASSSASGGSSRASADPQANTNSYNGDPAALPAAAGDYPVPAGTDYGSMRSDSSAAAAQQGPTPPYTDGGPPYTDSGPMRDAGARQAAAFTSGAPAESLQAGTMHAEASQGGAVYGGGAGTSQPGIGQGAMEPGVARPAGPGHAGPGQAGVHQRTSGRAGTGQVAADLGDVDQYGRGPLGNGRIDLEQSAVHARAGELGAAQAGTGQFAGHPGQGQFGTQAGQEQFGAGQGRAGQFPGHVAPDHFGGRPSLPGTPELVGQEHARGTEASRSTGQPAAQAGQQPVGTGPHARPPQHPGTGGGSIYEGAHGASRPRREYDVSQDPFVPRSAPTSSGAGELGAVREPAGQQHAVPAVSPAPQGGVAQHASPQYRSHGGPAQHVPGAHPNDGGHAATQGRGHERPVQDEQNRVARGIHVQPGPYENGQATAGAAASYQNGGPPAGYQATAGGQVVSGQRFPDVRPRDAFGSTGYQGSRDGYQTAPGLNGSAPGAAPGYHGDQGAGRYPSFTPHQSGSPLNGGAENGGPRGDEASRNPSAGFAAAPAPAQPQPYGPPDRRYIPGQPGAFTQGPRAPGSDQAARSAYRSAQPPGGGTYAQYQDASALPAVRPAQPVAVSLSEAVKAAHGEGYIFGESVSRGAPGLWLEAVLARKPRMPSDLEARLLQGSSLPIDSLLHDDVRHSLRRGFWDALESVRR